MTIVDQLSALTLGLLLMSESEAPWTVLTQLPAVSDKETIEVHAFFNKQIHEQDLSDEFMQKQAVQYKKLKLFIDENFTSVQMYKTGKIKRTVVIELMSKDGNTFFLTSTSIET